MPLLHPDAGLRRYGTQSLDTYLRHATALHLHYAITASIEDEGFSAFRDASQPEEHKTSHGFVPCSSRELNAVLIVELTQSQ